MAVPVKVLRKGIFSLKLMKEQYVSVFNVYSMKAAKQKKKDKREETKKLLEDQLGVQQYEP